MKKILPAISIVFISFLTIGCLDNKDVYNVFETRNAHQHLLKAKAVLQKSTGDPPEGEIRN